MGWPLSIPLNFDMLQLWLVVQVGDTVVALFIRRLPTALRTWPVLVKK
jgi:hypothetical protein